MAQRRSSRRPRWFVIALLVILGYFGSMIVSQGLYLLNLRNTPELRFVLDESLAYGMKMDKLIDEVIRKDEMKNE